MTTDELMQAIEGYKRGSVRFDFIESAIQQLVQERDMKHGAWALQKIAREKAEAERDKWQADWKTQFDLYQDARSRMMKAEAEIKGAHDEYLEEHLACTKAEANYARALSDANRYWDYLIEALRDIDRLKGTVGCTAIVDADQNAAARTAEKAEAEVERLKALLQLAVEADLNQPRSVFGHELLDSIVSALNKG
jgi:hypothetical protein